MSLIDCPNCGGTGEQLLFNLFSTCGKCRGSGKIVVDQAPLPPSPPDDDDYEEYPYFF